MSEDKLQKLAELLAKPLAEAQQFWPLASAWLDEYEKIAAAHIVKLRARISVEQELALRLKTCLCSVLKMDKENICEHWHFIASRALIPRTGPHATPFLKTFLDLINTIEIKDITFTKILELDIMQKPCDKDLIALKNIIQEIQNFPTTSIPREVMYLLENILFLKSLHQLQGEKIKDCQANPTDYTFAHMVDIFFLGQKEFSKIYEKAEKDGTILEPWSFIGRNFLLPKDQDKRQQFLSAVEPILRCSTLPDFFSLILNKPELQPLKSIIEELNKIPSANLPKDFMNLIKNIFIAGVSPDSVL
jgi:hypothetical protein